MTGRATQRDRDLDDWFAEPDQVLQQAHRPSTRADVDLESFEYAAPLPAPDDDDWLTADARREQTRPSVGRVALDGARPWVALVALVVLVAVGLVVSGVFNGSKTATPPAATGPLKTPTTTAQTDTTKAKTPTRPHIVQPTTTLKPGTTGAQVKLLQHALATLGYRPGKIDGRYGPATQRAVIRFQQAEGLTADGIFGTKTKVALAHAG
jgi:Putative peptidoglycan binding domain